MVLSFESSVKYLIGYLSILKGFPLTNINTNK